MQAGRHLLRLPASLPSPPRLTLSLGEGQEDQAGEGLGLWCENWRLLGEVGFVTLFLDKNHLALGELLGGVLVSYVAYTCVHMYTCS